MPMRGQDRLFIHHAAVASAYSLPAAVGMALEAPTGRAPLP